MPIQGHCLWQNFVLQKIANIDKIGESNGLRYSYQPPSTITSLLSIMAYLYLSLIPSAPDNFEANSRPHIIWSINISVCTWKIQLFLKYNHNTIITSKENDSLLSSNIQAVFTFSQLSYIFLTVWVRIQVRSMFCHQSLCLFSFFSSFAYFFFPCNFLLQKLGHLSCRIFIYFSFL